MIQKYLKILLYIIAVLKVFPLWKEELRVLWAAVQWTLVKKRLIQKYIR